MDNTELTDMAHIVSVKEKPIIFETLTKREYFAGIILQALLSNPGYIGTYKNIISSSVRYADKLIENLEKQNKNEQNNKVPSLGQEE